MTLQFQRHGSGPEPVIALHDWMSTSSGFDDVRPYLSPEKFTYVFPDHRGYGASRQLEAAEVSTHSVAQDVVDIANHLGWERFHLIGHSMSGMIAQRVSLDAPERLKSVVLTTPVSASGMPLDAEGSALFEGAVHDDELFCAVAKMVTGGRLARPFYDRKLRHHRENVSQDAFRAFLKMWTSEDFSAQMGGLRTPALIITGAHDAPPFSAEVLSETIATWYADSILETIDGSGHYPMSETPPCFAGIVERFLESHA